MCRSSCQAFDLKSKHMCNQCLRSKSKTYVHHYWINSCYSSVCTLKGFISFLLAWFLQFFLALEISVLKRGKKHLMLTAINLCVDFCYILSQFHNDPFLPHLLPLFLGFAMMFNCQLLFSLLLLLRGSNSYLVGSSPKLKWTSFALFCPLFLTISGRNPAGDLLWTIHLNWVL